MSTSDTRPACPLRQLLASRHLDGELSFGWPTEDCPDCQKPVTNGCTCGTSR